MKGPRSRTLPDLLDEMATRYPAREAVVGVGGRLTYGQWRARVRELARGFHRLGVRRGDKVSLLMPNRTEWLVIDFAVALLGATLVPISTWSRPRELEYVLNHCDAGTLVTVDRFLGQDYLAILGELGPCSACLPRLRRVVALGGERRPGITPFEEVAALGRTALAVPTDMSDRSAVEALVGATTEGLGGLDILVNNVGGLFAGTLEGLTAERWEKILNLKLMAAVHTTKHALPYLKKSKAGRVLNVSGVTGRQLLPGSWTTGLTNSAIIAFSKLMAADLGAAGVTVNNICPGFTNVKSWAPRAEAMAKARNTTADQVRAGIAGQTLLGRWAEPEEIGNVAAFLVSAKNSYMTGTTVEVCGGFTRYI